MVFGLLAPRFPLSHALVLCLRRARREPGCVETHLIFVSGQPGSRGSSAWHGPGFTACSGNQTSQNCIPRARPSHIQVTNHAPRFRLSTMDIQETLLTEKASLVNTVQKLNKDVAKLEVFKKTLMQSLQEDDDGVNTAPRARVAEAPNFSLASSSVAGPNSKMSQFSETASSVSDESRADPDVPRPPRPHVFLPSYNGTPRITPPDSPPRRHSISVTSMNMLNDRSSVFSGQYSSPFDAPSQTGRTRVDGKEFFRQVRNRLSYEQFSAFLANVKELNANRQTREETLRKADEIFGLENKDLYTIFGSLITRNIQ